MTEQRYEVAIYDDRAVAGYCVLDKEKPSQTARLKYKNIFISTKHGCNLVCELMNEKEATIKELQKQLNSNNDFIADSISDYSTLENEKENITRVLNDFMKILNEIQYYFKDGVTLYDLDHKDWMDLLTLCSKARDMLRMMGVELK